MAISRLNLFRIDARRFDTGAKRQDSLPTRDDDDVSRHRRSARPRAARRANAALMLPLLALLGCEGVIQDPAIRGSLDDGGSPYIPPSDSRVPPSDSGAPVPSATPLAASQACTSPSVESTPLRRLTRTEYRFAVQDLLGQAPRNVSSMVDDPRSDEQREGLTRGYFVGTHVSLTLATQYLDNASDAASQAAARIASECAPMNMECISTLVRRLGRRAFRRPLSTQQVDALT